MTTQNENVPALRFPEFNEDWKEKSLREITILITKGTTPNKFVESGINFVKIECLLNDSIDLTKCLFIDESTHSKELKRSILKEGDLLFAIAGATVGKCGIVSKEVLPANTNQALSIIRLKENENLKFVFLNLQSPNMKRYIKESIAVGAQPNLNLEQIGSFSFFQPNYNEQQKIAAFLTAVDEKIQQLAGKKDLLEQYKKGVMQKIFNQEIRFKDDNGNDFADWEEVSIIDLADKKIKWSFTGGPFGSNLKAQDYTETGIRIIQLQNIGDGVFLDDYKIYTSPQKADELLSCNIYPNDIIISKMGDPVARACILPEIEWNRYLMASDGIRLAVDKNKFVTKYVHDYINFSKFRKKALEVSTGSTRRRIGLSELRNLTIESPSFPEQQKIAAFLSSIDDKINLVNQQLEKTKEYKKGLLQQMFV